MENAVICPKCNGGRTQFLNEDGNRHYCPDCKYSWSSIGEKKDQHQMEFKGSLEAQKLVQLLTQNLNLSKEVRATFLAQINNALYENWFEGFKAGLMADIVHNLENENDNGKNWNEPGSSNREYRDGDRPSGKQDGEDGIGRVTTGKTTKRVDKVKEYVCGVEVTRPVNLEVSDTSYASLAEIIAAIGAPAISNVELSTQGIIFKVNPVYLKKLTQSI